uniref:Cytochrome c-553 n=1 Tax=Polysiphonia scopulorum TaxID=257860 RepID=A0A1Z1MI23_9FLOR|nr:cytochrome c553 [Polysiphonia scopulorum]ARW65502.1 cytochrome c553 [Polysiphonia scopulorum]
MRLFFSFLLSFFSMLAISSNLVFAQEVKVDLDAGEQVFSQNCIGCHAGGNNLVNPAKTLSLADLHENEKDSVEAIVYQVTNGAAGMPVFSGRLSEEEILNVANFVFSQAKNNSW